jgi:hypothetical protein
MDTKELFLKAVKKYSRILMQDCLVSPKSPERLLEHLFADVVGEVLTAPKKGGTVPKAEETAIELGRQGVPRESMHIGFQQVTVPLRNSTCILHRIKFPAGTVEVDWKKYRRVVTSSRPAKELASIILELDELLPMLEIKWKELLDRILVEMKALQIQRITVKSQLEAVLPALGIQCGFDVKDDKVELHLTRTFTGAVNIPLAELSSFLADPDRILATLQPYKDGRVEDVDNTFMPHFGHNIRIH